MENFLRFKDIAGQKEVTSRLSAFIGFFRSTGGVLGHILLIGEDGMGKATIAEAFAGELGVVFQKLDTSKIEAQGDLTAIMANMRERQVLLLSNPQHLRNIYLSRVIEVLRNFRMEIVIGQGPAARKHVIEVKPFTLISTCVKKPDCPAELFGEFSLVLSLQPYTRSELQLIADKIARSMRASLSAGAAELIARSCDGKPGHLEPILQRLIRSINKQEISENDVVQAFSAFGISVRQDASANEAGSIQNLSREDFERLITKLLFRMGFQAEMTKTTGDGGIDIVATLDKPIFGGRYLFQCKRFAPDNLISSPTVRDFYGAVTADRAVKGIFITTSTFSNQAREFGERVGIELIDFAQLQRLFIEYDMGLDA